jgi:hypothetical protein
MILPTGFPCEEYWYQTKASASPWHFRHRSVSRLYIAVLHPTERDRATLGDLNLKYATLIAAALRRADKVGSCSGG